MSNRYYLFGVESDKKTERVMFKCPKIVGDNVDLSKYSVRINYQNASGKQYMYVVDDLIVEGDNVIFGWLLDRTATLYKGTVSFIVCAVRVSEYRIENEWNTTLAYGNVVEGLEVDAIIDEEEETTIENLIAQMTSKITETSNAIRSAEESIDNMNRDIQTIIDKLNTVADSEKVEVSEFTDTEITRAKNAIDSASESAVQTAKTDIANTADTERTRVINDITGAFNAELGYSKFNDIVCMGAECKAGVVKLDSISGNTILSGTPAYDAPVSMAWVESPLNLHFSGKNLIDLNRATSQSDTVSGVSYSIKNGEIAISGTCGNAGSNLYFSLFGTNKSRMMRIPKGTYTFSGCSLENYAKGVLLYLNVRNLNEEYVSDKSLSNTESITFTLSEDALVQPSIRIVDGSHVDGVILYPQLEVGDMKTDFETYRGSPYVFNTVNGIDIPLLGTDGQTLEPLRMAYTGTASIGKTAHYDRIFRKDGIWNIERNVKLIDMTEATWYKSSTYFIVGNAGVSIKDAGLSYCPFCTHFAERGVAAGSLTSNGVWTNGQIYIGNDVLPNGAETTVSEMKEFCAAQAEDGTPVLLCYALAEPIYEELHQDVQVLLNTLTVPGGVCSIWFEDTKLSGASISMPHGDTPTVGMDGAYKWLHALSNSLVVNNGEDLYEWALKQQRGGVFIIGDLDTVVNAPTSDSKLGFLLVGVQGSDVALFMFGGDGALYVNSSKKSNWNEWSKMSTSSDVTINEN